LLWFTVGLNSTVGSNLPQCRPALALSLLCYAPALWQVDEPAEMLVGQLPTSLYPAAAFHTQHAVLCCAVLCTPVFLQVDEPAEMQVEEPPSEALLAEAALEGEQEEEGEKGEPVSAEPEAEVAEEVLPQQHPGMAAPPGVQGGSLVGFGLVWFGWVGLGWVGLQGAAGRGAGPSVAIRR